MCEVEVMVVSWRSTLYRYGMIRGSARGTRAGNQSEARRDDEANVMRAEGMGGVS